MSDVTTAVTDWPFAFSVFAVVMITVAVGMAVLLLKDWLERRKR